MNHYVYWLRGEKFAELAALSIESIQRVDANAKFHVWTDASASTPKLPDTVWHATEKAPSRPAMVANLDAQIAALNYLQRGERVLFLDADTLLLRPFPWTLAADLCVTWRGEVNGERDLAILQPYNYGVIAANVSPVVLEAFYWIRARILNMSKQNQEWYGNQLALAELVGAAPHVGTEDKEARIRWSLQDVGTLIRIRQLPCDVFNYSPNEAGENIRGKAILHLKGDRKDLMQHYLEAA